MVSRLSKDVLLEVDGLESVSQSYCRPHRLGTILLVTATTALVTDPSRLPTSRTNEDIRVEISPGFRSIRLPGTPDVLAHPLGFAATPLHRLILVRVSQPTQYHALRGVSAMGAGPSGRSPSLLTRLRPNWTAVHAWIHHKRIVRRRDGLKGQHAMSGKCSKL